MYVLWLNVIHCICLFIHIVAMASPLTLLIGYYHGVLLRDINADLLIHDMCSKCLLDVHDQSLISAGHSVHHRNCLLLERIRHMDKQAFSAFCNLVPEVGSQLITAVCKLCMWLHTYIHSMSLGSHVQSILILHVLYCIIRMYNEC